MIQIIIFQGICYFEDKSFYQGNWIRGKMSGYGEFYDKITDILYLGYFENNRKNGFGIERNFEKNIIYIGQFHENKREGISRVFNEDIEIFSLYEKDREIKKYERRNEINNEINTRFKDQIIYFNKNLKEIKDYISKERIIDQ